MDAVHRPGLAGAGALAQLRVRARARDRRCSSPGPAADPLRRQAGRPVRQATLLHRRQRGRSACWRSCSACWSPPTPSPCGWVFVLRRAHGHGERDRDPGAPGVRLRDWSAASCCPTRCRCRPRRSTPRASSARRWPVSRSAGRHRPGVPAQRRDSTWRRWCSLHADATRPSCSASRGHRRPGQHPRRAALRVAPRRPAAAARADHVRGRPVRVQLPAHPGRAGQDRVPHRCRTSSACSPRRWRSARWAARWPAAPAGPGRACTWCSAAAIVFGAARDAGRVRADVLAHGRAAGADRVLHDLLCPGHQPAHPARHRRGVPGPGDGAVSCWSSSARRPLGAPIIGWRQRAVRAAVGRLGRRADLAGRGRGRAGVAAAPLRFAARVRLRPRPRLSSRPVGARHRRADPRRATSSADRGARAG